MSNTIINFIFSLVDKVQGFLNTFFVSETHAEGFGTANYDYPPLAGMIATPLPGEIIKENWYYFLIPVVLVIAALFFGTKGLIKILKKGKKKSKKK